MFYLLIYRGVKIKTLILNENSPFGVYLRIKQMWGVVVARGANNATDVIWRLRLKQHSWEMWLSRFCSNTNVPQSSHLFLRSLRPNLTFYCLSIVISFICLLNSIDSLVPLYYIFLWLMLVGHYSAIENVLGEIHQILDAY